MLDVDTRLQYLLLFRFIHARKLTVLTEVRVQVQIPDNKLPIISHLPRTETDDLFGNVASSLWLGTTRPILHTLVTIQISLRRPWSIFLWIFYLPCLGDSLLKWPSSSYPLVWVSTNSPWGYPHKAIFKKLQYWFYYYFIYLGTSLYVSMCLTFKQFIK